MLLFKMRNVVLNLGFISPKLVINPLRELIHFPSLDPDFRYAGPALRKAEWWNVC